MIRLFLFVLSVLLAYNFVGYYTEFTTALHGNDPVNLVANLGMLFVVVLLQVLIVLTLILVEIWDLNQKVPHISIAALHNPENAD